MADGDEDVRFTGGAPEAIERWWRRLPLGRRVAIVVGAVYLVGYLVVGLLAFEGVISGWISVYGTLGYALIALLGGIVNRRDRNRELDEIARRAAEGEPDDNP